MADMTLTRPKGRVPRGTLMGGLVALVAFVLLVPMIAFLALRSGGAAGGARTTVVVAANDIALRATISPSDLTTRALATDDVPPQAFLHVADAKGMVAAGSIVKGQVITRNLVAQNPDQVAGPDLAYLPLPTGYVGITIPASEQQAVAGYVRPGDYVTVIAVVPALSKGPNGTGASLTDARTVFTNLHVIKVGAIGSTKPTTTATNGQASTQPVSMTSLTVVMTQCQAEVMTWFINNAQLKYTLESYHDYTPQAQVDQGCPNVKAAGGVTESDVARLYPGIFNG